MPTPRKHKDAAACQAAYRERQQEARRQRSYGALPQAARPTRQRRGSCASPRERERKGLPNLPSIPTIPGERRWATMISEATALVQIVVDERGAYDDDRSEDWRDSEKGEAFQERTDTVIDLLVSLEDVALSS